MAEELDDRNTYKVKLAHKSECVTADYFKIEDGVLTFCNANPNQGYPQFVKCYANGVWLSVENLFGEIEE